MPEGHRVELVIPISEISLLDFLLSRYPREELDKIGVQASNSVIRDFQIAPDGKCNFRVCVISLVDAERVLLETKESPPESCETCAGVCGMASDDKCLENTQKAIRVEKGKKLSNS